MYVGFLMQKKKNTYCLENPTILQHGGGLAMNGFENETMNGFEYKTMNGFE